MRVLITGGNGFIGRETAGACRRQGHEVFALVRRKGSVGIKGVRELGLAENVPGRFLEPLRLSRPDLVVHCAGLASVPLSEERADECRADNVDLVAEVLGAVREAAPRACFILPSSAAVYGSPARQPVNEQAPRVPISTYGQSKVEAENLVFAHAKRYPGRCAIVRLFSVYGAGQKRLLIWELISQGLRKEFPLTLRGTGDEVRDFLHVSDLPRAVLTIVGAGPCEGEAYNVASGEAVSVRATALMISRLLNGPGEVKVRGIADETVPARWEADIGMVKSLGFSASVSLEEGLGRTVSWARELKPGDLSCRG